MLRTRRAAKGDCGQRTAGPLPPSPGGGREAVCRRTPGPSPPPSPRRSGEHRYMYVRLPNLIQAQGQLTRKLAFQPASLDSNLHKQLRAAADKLHVKTQRVRGVGVVGCRGGWMGGWVGGWVGGVGGWVCGGGGGGGGGGAGLGGSMPRQPQVASGCSRHRLQLPTHRRRRASSRLPAGRAPASPRAHALSAPRASFLLMLARPPHRPRFVLVPRCCVHRCAPPPRSSTRRRCTWSVRRQRRSASGTAKSWRRRRWAAVVAVPCRPAAAPRSVSCSLLCCAPCCAALLSRPGGACRVQTRGAPQPGAALHHSVQRRWASRLGAPP